jgi:hypothetical protein
MRRFPALLAIALVAANAACASKNPSSGTASGGAATAARRDPTVIDEAELHGGTHASVFDLIRSTRADWLLARGGPSGGQMPQLGVWTDASQRSRGVDYLRTISPKDIKRVKRLSTTETLQSYNWPWGGLVVTSR